MFKAKLIKDERVYRLKQNAMYFIFLGIFIGFIVNADKFPYWLTVIISVLFFTYVIYTYRRVQLLKKIMGKGVLEMSGDQIRLISQNNEKSQILEVSKVDGIVFKKDYRLPEENWHDIVDVMRGKYQKNYLIIEQENESKRYDFELDSYYMLAQLEKIIKDWTAKGYPVRRIEN